MKLYTLTKEEIEALTHKRDMKKMELDTLTQTTIKQLWLREMDDFITLYNKTLVTKKSTKKKTKKSIKKKTKKSIKKKTNKTTK